MEAEIMVALIGGGSALLGSFAGVMANGKLTNHRLEQLEKKVDKHNGLIDRMYLNEANVDVLEEKVKVVNHRIEDLEAYHK